MTSSLSYHLPSLAMAPHLLIFVFHILVGPRPLSFSRLPSSLTNLLYSLAYLFASSTFHRIPYSSHPQGPFCCLFVIFFLTWRDRISMGVWVVCSFVFISIYFSYLVLSLFILFIPCTSPFFLLCLFLFTSDVVCFRGLSPSLFVNNSREDLVRSCE